MNKWDRSENLPQGRMNIQMRLKLHICVRFGDVHNGKKFRKQGDKQNGLVFFGMSLPFSAVVSALWHRMTSSFELN